MLDATRSQPPTLLDEVRKVLRLQHYSIHTERAYVEWIRRFVRFHGMRSREDLFPAEPKIEALLTNLAVHGNVAAATQNQAMNALVFLYKRALNHALPDRINAIRASQKDQRPGRDDPRRSRRCPGAYGRHRPASGQAPLWEWAAYHGSGPAAR